MPRLCPSCSLPLRTVSVNTVAVEGCDTCGGIWFDAGEPRQVAEQGATQLAALDASFKVSASAPRATQTRCPVCTPGLLTPIPLAASGVVADQCPTCKGLWLNHGELTIIAQHLRPAPAPPATRGVSESVCPLCGAVLRPGATYCSVCIAPLADSARALPLMTIEQYAMRPLLWVVSAPLVLLLAYALLRAFDAAWFLFLIGPPIAVACLIGAFHEWTEGEYLRAAASFARHRHLSFARRLTASDLVERFADLAILFEGGPLGGTLFSEGGRTGVYRNQYVMQRRTASEEIFAFTLYHDLFVGGSFAGGSKPVAIIARSTWEFPTTIIRPRTLAHAAATVASWMDQDASCGEDRFNQQFSIETEDAAFAGRLLTPDLRSELVRTGGFAVELRGQVVAAAPLIESPRVIAAPLAGYTSALLLARAASEAAMVALRAPAGEHRLTDGGPTIGRGPNTR